MKNIKIKLSLIFITFCMFSSYSQTEEDAQVLLEFKFREGDQSRILSTVDEDVYINGRFNHRAKILNRIFYKITEVDEKGSGKAEATFMTSESAVGAGRNFSYGEEYQSVFWRDKQGYYDIEDIYFMPTVRDVPVFPKKAVKPGDKWTCEGHEAHDLRQTFNLSKPFKVPFTATYEYKGSIYDKIQQKDLEYIEVKYDMYFKSPKPNRLTQEMMNAPSVTMGHSFQRIWWDNERGEIDHYSEEFKIIIETFYGDQITFGGTAHAEVTEFERLNNEENLQKIQESVAELGFKDIDVKQSEKGLTISIENIQFEPDSSRLLESEKNKLKKIAEILKRFNNDILVTGHCADRGTVKNQLKISDERAVSVAEYLSLLEVRDPNCIFTQGKGASEPVASNSTEQGRARNRRVEITLMDE